MDSDLFTKLQTLEAKLKSNDKLNDALIKDFNSNAENLKNINLYLRNQVESLKRTYDNAAAAPQPASKPVVQDTKIAEDVAAQLTADLRRELFSPENFAEILGRYQGWLADRSAEERKKDLVARLPELLDLLDNELREWKSANNEGVSSEERQRVVEVLEKLQRRQEAWRRSVGLVRFPNEGEAFDRMKHEKHRTTETTDPARRDTVAEVLRSGYQFDGETVPLRAARVVVHVLPHDEDPAST